MKVECQEAHWGAKYWGAAAGGRELRSISLSDCADGAGSCVCGEEDTAGEVDGTRETEVGPAGDLTPGEAAGEGWGAGAGGSPHLAKGEARELREEELS